MFDFIKVEILFRVTWCYYQIIVTFRKFLIDSHEKWKLSFVMLVFITKFMKVYYLFSKKYYTSCIQMRKKHTLQTILRIFLISRKSFSHNVSFWITDNTPPHINIQVKNNKRKLLPITFDHACFLSSNFCFELPILWRNWKSLVSHPSVANGKSTHIIYHFFDSIRDHIKIIVVQIY